MRGKMPYLDDSLLYSLWKFLSTENITGTDLFKLEEIKRLRRDPSSSSDIFASLKKVGIESSGDMTKLSQKDKRLFESVLDHLYGYDMDSYDSLECLPLKNVKVLKKFVGSYIDDFIHGNLQEGKHNYYDFNRQKKQIFYELIDSQEKYGKNFILEYPDRYELSIGTITDKEFLFMHSLMAMERLGYLKIDSAWIYDAELSSKEQSRNYKVRLILKQKYIEEKTNKARNNTGKVTSKEQKKVIDFNEATSILKIGKKNIKLKMGGDEYHMLKIIFQNKQEISKEWFFSEIADEYEGDGLGEAHKDKKFYNASFQVIQKIKLEARLSDVLITTSHSIRINPSYLDQT